MYRLFTLTVYIWIFIDIYMLSFVMFFSEIKYYIKNGGDQDFGHGQEGQYEEPRGNYVSLSITCVLLVFPILFFISVCISWNYVKDIVKIESTYKMRHLYDGILKVPQQLRSQQVQNYQDESQSEDQSENQNKDQSKDQSEDQIKDQSENQSEDKIEDQSEDQIEYQSEDQTEETESNVPKQIKIARLYSLLYLIKSFVIAFIVVFLPNSIYELKI